MAPLIESGHFLNQKLADYIHTNTHTQPHTHRKASMVAGTLPINVINLRDIRIVQRRGSFSLISFPRFMLNLVWRTVPSATAGTWGRMAGMLRNPSWWMEGIRMRRSIFSKFYFGKKTVCEEIFFNFQVQSTFTIFYFFGSSLTIYQQQD